MIRIQFQNRKIRFEYSLNTFSKQKYYPTHKQKQSATITIAPEMKTCFRPPRGRHLSQSRLASRLRALALAKKPLLAQIPAGVGHACKPGPGSCSGLKANHVVLVRLLIMERTRLHSSAPGYHQPHRPALSLLRAIGLALANQAGAHNDGKNKRKMAMTQIHMPSLN